MEIETLNIPANVKNCLSDLVAEYELVLRDNLSGIYLHGSIAMNCFNSESSDIDVLVVVKNKLTSEIKMQLGQLHIKLSNRYHKNIELSVVLDDVLKFFNYPTPFEFHYSDDHKSDFLAGNADFSPRTDPDLAAHFVITKKYGIALVGDSVTEVFPDVPHHHYLDSISKDSEWSYENIIKGKESGDCSVPKYAVLNFCRVLAFIKDGLITSKKTGAEWAITSVPKQFTSVIQEALAEYEKAGSSNTVSCTVLKDFARYSKFKIDNAKSLSSWSQITRDEIEGFGDSGDPSRQYLLNPAIFNLLGEVSGKKILDAGCGTGYLSRLLTEKGAVVTGVEPTKPFYDYCIERELVALQGIKYGASHQ